MIINTMVARAEWAARVSKQAEQMLIIAAATNDDEMRDELLGFAERLTAHASQIDAVRTLSQAEDRSRIGREPYL